MRDVNKHPAVEMQVLLKGSEWASVRPSGEEPYRFRSRESARRSLERCYPDDCVVSRLSGDPRYEGKPGTTVRLVDVELDRLPEYLDDERQDP